LALTMTIRDLNVWLAALLLLAAGGAWADAGRFQFVAGQVTVVGAGGGSRAAAKGDLVREGEVITTASDASAQLRMADEGLIALRPDSSLRIESYRFQGQAAGGERSILALLKGGFRALTGLIGRSRKEAYQVRTATATIGIRGTDHEPVHIPEGGWSGAPGGVPGTYDKVNEGATYLETPGGRLELAANEVGFVPLQAGAVPVRLDGTPAFMRVTPAPLGKADVRNLRQEAAADRAMADDATDSGRPRAHRPALLAGPLPADGVGPNVLPTADVVTAGGGLTAAPRGLAVAGADQYLDGRPPGSGAGVTQPGDLTVLRDPSGLIGVVGSAEGFRYSRGDARLVHGGSATIVDGLVEIPVRWGIYAGGHIVDRQGERLPRFMSVISALPATSDAQLAALSGLGSRTFSLLDASKPTNGAGLVGGVVNAATVTVDFTALAVTGSHLRVTDAQGFVFDGGTKTPVSLTAFAASGMPLAVGLTTPSADTLAVQPNQGHFHGVLVGPSGRGLIGAYDMRYPLGPDPRSVAGVVVLQR
jgi:hypothetical protein